MLATRPDIDTIAITRTFDGIEEAAHRVIEQVGGMESVIRGAKFAILKPNFVAWRKETPPLPYSTYLRGSPPDQSACAQDARGLYDDAEHEECYGYSATSRPPQHAYLWHRSEHRRYESGH